ncbi:MAG: menaquinone biosynthesis protein [Planctomycetales bacterium]
MSEAHTPGYRPHPIRVGAVNYLNSKPLIEGLADLAPSIELHLDFPSRLADRLAQGELDVALIPSVSCLGNPHYEIASDACVATRGKVLSVKLYSRVPIRQIKTLALDVGSRTSAALSRILLAERYHVLPQLQPLPFGLSTRESNADAVLLIGDRAIPQPEESFTEVWDLGEEWTNWTGLPFVFAMWATRRGTDLGTVEEALSAARDRGLEKVREIAVRESAILNLTHQLVHEYLTQNLYFYLGPEERRGLQRYYQLAVKQGLAPEGIPLVFRNCAAA